MLQAYQDPKSGFYTEDDYYNLPDNVRAELIHGQFYNLASPSRMHQEILVFLFRKIGNYIESKNGSYKIYPAPFAVKLFEDKETIVEPDISVICNPDRLTDRGCSGAPDWTIEIASPSNPGHDFIYKLNLYAEAGVREYWIISPDTETIFVYHLEKDNFKVTPYTFQDSIKAGIYEDLWIDFHEFHF